MNKLSRFLVISHVSGRPITVFGTRSTHGFHAALLGLTLASFLAGCQTSGVVSPAASSSTKTEAVADQHNSTPLTLREGDVVKVSIPGASNLDATQPIRRDGRIALALVGEVQAAGLTPAELQAELIKLYGPQLVSKEVTVTVVSSSFVAFVSGAVLHPGKIMSDHPVTVLEAIMEAGGPDYAKANLKAVVVVRQSPDGKTQNFTLNVKSVLDGKNGEPFFLRPSDIVYVPERFAIF